VTATRYIADLHIHSLYSRATSKASNLHGLAAWAAIKGITVVGTGDFTHPAWLAHLTRHLEPAEPGFFRLRTPPDYKELSPLLPPDVMPDVSGIRFVLTAEISSIYKRHGRVRKVHNVLFAPDFESVRKINTTLAGIGNLESDGRPILGLDSQRLLEIQLEKAPQGFLVPAHIWTPWFSLFGSKSGFDAVEECFGDLSNEIFALETGLSSDPEMNRCISALDRYTLISNSDCHSPSKLGREANIFHTDFDFFAMRNALRRPVDDMGRQCFEATIEFYPEEGKYHCDGHRKCGICLEPEQTVKEKGLCPECGRPLTIGVLYRVMELADRSEPVYPPGSPAVHSLVPLPELLGEMYGCGAGTKKVAGVYGKLMNRFGSEFSLLLDVPISDIDEISPLLGEAVKRVRENRVIRQPGFDGEFGVIRVFSEEDLAAFGGQLNLFGVRPAKSRRLRKKTGQIRPRGRNTRSKKKIVSTLNQEQQAAVNCTDARILVTAGPGTGKTHTLVQRVVRLLQEKPRPMTVITFTNKAVEEVAGRISAAGVQERVAVRTFHSFCLDWLRREQGALQLVGPEMRSRLLEQAYPGLNVAERRDVSRRAALYLAEQPRLATTFPRELQPFFTLLQENNLLDLDAVVPALTALLEDDRALADRVGAETGHLLVDEFQDLNCAQYELVRILSRSCPVFAIGDPDQAIYGFRGSRPAWFYRFQEELQPKRFFLPVNYRSGARILQAAAAVIDQTPDRRTAALQPAGGKPGKIYRYTASNPEAEARFVADRIQLLIGGTSHREIDRLETGREQGLALSDIAVLYRTGKQARELADALTDRSLPFQVVDMRPFYQEGKTKILYYHILLAAASADKAELLFLLGHEPGIGTKSLKQLDRLLPEASDDFPALLEENAGGLSSRLRASVMAFCGRVRRVQHQAAESLTTAVQELIRHYTPDPEDPDILRFLNMSGSAQSLAAFADHLRRFQDSVVYDDRAESVLLATLHAAKGLEFKAVFMVGCEEGLLPLAPRGHKIDEAPAEHVEEERRLFYVGMTRAEEILYITCAAERAGYSGVEKHAPSRFSAAIPEELLIHSPEPVKAIQKRTRACQLRLF
jgi:uncharacterized protein (TIGR00375 family)